MEALKIEPLRIRIALPSAIRRLAPLLRIFRVDVRDDWEITIPLGSLLDWVVDKVLGHPVLAERIMKSLMTTRYSEDEARGIVELVVRKAQSEVAQAEED